jgi:hypothetical protein
MDEKHVNAASALFRDIVGRDDALTRMKTELPGAAAPVRRISLPHPYYFIDGGAVLRGQFAGAERMTGYQSVVVEGEAPTEVLVASMTGDTMAYAAAWPRRAAEALTEALRVAERNGIHDTEFAVVTVPEVAFNAVWFRTRAQLVPLRLNTKKSGLDPERVYSEGEVIERLQAPLRARFAITGSGVDDTGRPKAPRA